MTNIEDRQVVGFLRQAVILFWKNGLLFKRNIAGTICEILVALLFLAILLLMRYFVDVSSFSDQDSVTNRLIYVTAAINATTGRNLIMYYPDNPFIQGIAQQAYQIIKHIRPDFNATSKKIN
jgi:hypothetical protein